MSHPPRTDPNPPVTQRDTTNANGSPTAAPAITRENIASDAETSTQQVGGVDPGTGEFSSGNHTTTPGPAATQVDTSTGTQGDLGGGNKAGVNPNAVAQSGSAPVYSQGATTGAFDTEQAGPPIAPGHEPQTPYKAPSLGVSANNIDTTSAGPPGTEGVYSSETGLYGGNEPDVEPIPASYDISHQPQTTSGGVGPFDPAHGKLDHPLAPSGVLATAAPRGISVTWTPPTGGPTIAEITDYTVYAYQVRSAGFSPFDPNAAHAVNVLNQDEAHSGPEGVEGQSGLSEPYSVNEPISPSQTKIVSADNPTAFMDRLAYDPDFGYVFAVSARNVNGEGPRSAVTVNPVRPIRPELPVTLSSTGGPNLEEAPQARVNPVYRADGSIVTGTGIAVPSATKSPTALALARVDATHATVTWTAPTDLGGGTLATTGTEAVLFFHGNSVVNATTGYNAETSETVDQNEFQVNVPGASGTTVDITALPPGDYSVSVALVFADGTQTARSTRLAYRV